MMNAPSAPFQSASLYVGDLHPDATEGLLFELFSRVGPVASIRVCRDAVTRRSLGYAYVNFHNVQDAERALDTMNFTDIKEKQCRIMWSQRDPTLRKTGVGNIFIKNLAISIDNKSLFDTFSVFGNILSCKVITDDEGNSKGYGYVHFETAESAQEAMKKLDGCQIEGQTVNVISYQRRADRAGQNDWTNIYLKQFPLTWTEETLNSMVSIYGDVTSLVISKDEEGKSKGFAFINFENHDAAAACLEELNNKVVEDNGESFTIYASQAQKKAERERELKKQADAAKQEKIMKLQGMNLYVKNIDDSVTDEQFREYFAPYGTITSARIMRDENNGNVSKGFGFVCYSSAEEASKAVAEMNNKVILNKPITVTLHQRKDLRQQQLAASFNARNAMNTGVNMGGRGGYNNMNQNPNAMYNQNMYNQGNNYMMNNGGRGNPNYNNGGRGNMNNQYGMPNYMQGGRGNMNQGPNNMQGNNGMRQNNYMNGNNPNMMMMQGRGGPMQGRGGPMQGRGGPNGRGMMNNNMMNPQMRGNMPMNNVKFNMQARNQPPMPMPMNNMMMQGGNVMPPMDPQQQQPQHNPSDQRLDEIALAQADPQTQKNMIGERLYPLICTHRPDQAGKITGMLLEMENSELLHLIVTPDALKAKIDEALDVLQKHQTGSE